MSTLAVIRLSSAATLLATLACSTIPGVSQAAQPRKTAAGPAAHRRAVPKAAPCAAPMPPPEVPAGLPPAPGVVKVQTTFALRYVDTVVGTGAEAVPGATVSLHYTGWLASDGTKFDSSFDHPDKQPIQLPLGGGRVIPGWDQGIVGMKQGGKRRLFIPYPLAYGTNGRPPRIPAKSDLIFDVELVDVSAEAGPAPSPVLAQPPSGNRPVPRPPAASAPPTPPSAAPSTAPEKPKPATPPTTPQ